MKTKYINTSGWAERDAARFGTCPKEIEYRVPLSPLAQAYTGRESVIVVLKDHGDYDKIMVASSAMDPVIRKDYPEWDWVRAVDERLCSQLNKTDWYANAYCPGSPGHDLAWDPEAKIFRLSREMAGDPEVYEVPIYRSPTSHLEREADAMAADVPGSHVAFNGPLGRRLYWAQVDQGCCETCPKGWQESWQCDACLGVGLHNLGCWVELALEDRED